MAFTNVWGFVNTDNPELSILGVSGAWGEGVLVPLVFFTWAFSGVAGAVVALIALVRSQERSALVWIAMLPVLPTLLPLGWIVLVLASGLEIPTLWVMVVLAGLSGVLITWLLVLRWMDRKLSKKR
jgi:hypothetical protein